MKTDRSGVRHQDLGIARVLGHQLGGPVAVVTPKSPRPPHSWPPVPCLPTAIVKVPRGSWVIQNGANSGVERATVAIAKVRGLRAVNVYKGHLTDRGLALVSITRRLGALRSGDQLARPLGQAM